LPSSLPECRSARGALKSFHPGCPADPILSSNYMPFADMLIRMTSGF
jgi:hypothetical protein